MVALASDSMTRADSANLGANWTDDGKGAHWTISSNKAVPSAFNQDASAHYSAISWPNDHYSQAQITVSGTTGADAGNGVSVRQSGSGSLTLYVLSVDHAASNNVNLWKNVSGAFTHLAATTQTWTDGDTWRLEAQGTTLTVKLNGSTLSAMTTTDSSITSGNAGIYFSSVETSASLVNWEGGDFTGGGGAAPSRSRRLLVGVG